LLPKDLRLEHERAKLVSFFTGTSLRSWTSRLSRENGEICLQKYLLIRGKLSITSYLKQNDVDHRSHLTIENNLKVEKSYIISKSSTTFPPKKRLGYAQRQAYQTTRKQCNTRNLRGAALAAVLSPL